MIGFFWNNRSKCTNLQCYQTLSLLSRKIPWCAFHLAELQQFFQIRDLIRTSQNDLTLWVLRFFDQIWKRAEEQRNPRKVVIFHRKLLFSWQLFSQNGYNWWKPAKNLSYMVCPKIPELKVISWNVFTCFSRNKGKIAKNAAIKCYVVEFAVNGQMTGNLVHVTCRTCSSLNPDSNFCQLRFKMSENYIVSYFWDTFSVEIS